MNMLTNFSAEIRFFVTSDHFCFSLQCISVVTLLVCIFSLAQLSKEVVNDADTGLHKYIKYQNDGFAVVPSKPINNSTLVSTPMKLPLALLPKVNNGIVSSPGVEKRNPALDMRKFVLKQAKSLSLKNDDLTSFALHDMDDAPLSVGGSPPPRVRRNQTTSSPDGGSALDNTGGGGGDLNDDVTSVRTSVTNDSVRTYMTNNTVRTFMTDGTAKSFKHMQPTMTTTNTLGLAVKNTSVLVGWGVQISGYGKGRVIEIVKTKFRSTRFKILFDTGETKVLKLKRSEDKGDVPFTLMQNVEI